MYFQKQEATNSCPVTGDQKRSRKNVNQALRAEDLATQTSVINEPLLFGDSGHIKTQSCCASSIEKIVASFENLRKNIFASPAKGNAAIPFIQRKLRAVTQGRNLEVWSETQVMQMPCVQACSPWRSLLVFLYTPRSPAQGQHHL